MIKYNGVLPVYKGLHNMPPILYERVVVMTIMIRTTVYDIVTSSSIYESFFHFMQSEFMALQYKTILYDVIRVQRINPSTLSR